MPSRVYACVYDVSVISMAYIDGSVPNCCP